MRLDKYLSNAGVGSRSEVKKLVKAKKVKVNNNVVVKESITINELEDQIIVNDELIEYHEFHYLLMNKPAGYLSAREDKYQSTVLDLIPEYDFAKLSPVGRLDKDSTGLLLLTNNGKLIHRLLSPKYHVDKTYLVEVNYPLKESIIEQFESGIPLDDELTLPAKLIFLDEYHAKVIIHQGKFHQVKRMFKYFGYEVMSLQRIQFGDLTLTNIEEGHYRLLTKEEIENLLKI